MRHRNETLSDIWHDLLHRTCTDRQRVQKKHKLFILNIYVDVLEDLCRSKTKAKSYDNA
jgi:hypothetical protein